MYEETIPVLIRTPGAMKGVLDKGEAHPKDTGTDPDAVLQFSLVPVMALVRPRGRSHHICVRIWPPTGRRPLIPWFDHSDQRIYFEEEGSGAPVLLLPGFSDRIDDHGPLRAELAKRHRVIAADLPGSGRSEPRPRTYHARYYHEDAAAFDALLAHLGAAPAHVAGFSDGGEVALLMAALSPDRVRSVFAWGACGLLADDSGQLRAAMRSVVDNPPPPLRPYSEFLVSVYGERDARAMTQSFAEALDAILQRGGGLAYDIAERISCPVFLAVGDEDMFVPVEILNKAAARIADVEVHVVEGSGHQLHRSHGEWLRGQAAAWLERHA